MQGYNRCNWESSWKSWWDEPVWENNWNLDHSFSSVGGYQTPLIIFCSACHTFEIISCLINGLIIVFFSWSGCIGGHCWHLQASCCSNSVLFIYFHGKRHFGFDLFIWCCGHIPGSMAGDRPIYPLLGLPYAVYGLNIDIWGF